MVMVWNSVGVEYKGHFGVLKEQQIVRLRDAVKTSRICTFNSNFLIKSRKIHVAFYSNHILDQHFK